MRSRLQGRTHHPLRPGLRRGESAGDSRRRRARSGHRATSEDEPTWNIQGPRCREATVCSVHQDLLQPRAVTSPTRWRDAVHPRRSARQASGGRSRPRAHRSQRVPRHALGPGTERLVRRGGTIFADAATTTPPARAHGRRDARRRSWSSSRQRPQRRSGRSPPSRCPPAPPSQRVAELPALRLQRRKRTPHLVLRASTDAAATGERKPVPGIKAQPE
jgi:hypothetical protein